MTQETPPGWYPDPGHTSDGPATERWWDGKAWTDRIRPAEPAATWGPPTQPPPGPYPAAMGPYPAYPPAPPRRGLRTGIAIAVAAAVLASIGVGVYALTNDGGNETAASSQGPGGQNGQGGPGGQGGPDGGQGGPGGGSGGSGGSEGQSPAPDESAQPQIVDGYAVDPVNGIGIPVPDDWTAVSLSVGVQVTSKDSYKCPGDTSKSCTRGGAYSAPAEALRLDATTPEAAAKADIEKNAEESYGGTTYGKITSHDELASKAVTVAGEKGYMVRWKAVTSKGADGYVESLVFPAPANPDRLVVIRFGIDVGSKAPKQSVIDDITKGIKEMSGGGNGQNV
ncbi:DUF2510 domain-containing protein [Streptomyces spongiae]|uniref:DUF2510 domain-containing protein n=1 Tax=Streptomyces spongiae TaxID=565072 RepID=A0A5N8XYA9_9ACTN|nr:DUF2510 domain-containing protein [Streptomyces spongiae]MPY64347.1 DUF2510 domain-containing protein [Streptomyces spongiae]